MVKGKQEKARETEKGRGRDRVRVKVDKHQPLCLEAGTQLLIAGEREAQFVSPFTVTEVGEHTFNQRKKSVKASTSSLYPLSVHALWLTHGHHRAPATRIQQHHNLFTSLQLTLCLCITSYLHPSRRESFNFTTVPQLTHLIHPDCG